MIFLSPDPPWVTGNLLARLIANIFTEKSVVVPQGQGTDNAVVSLLFKIQNARSVKKIVALNFGN